MLISLIRTVLLYIVIIIAMRLMGKRQISEMQTSELVVTLLIPDIAAIPMQNAGIPLVSGFVPIAIIVACEIILSAIMVKNRKFRSLVCGKPMIIIKDGEIDQKIMSKLRISTQDLTEALRQLDVFSLQDVSYAIVETTGKMSVLKKAQKQPPDASVLGLVVPNQDLEMILVSNGEISDFSLSFCSLSKEWLKGVLAGEKTDLSDIFLMTGNKNKEYNIIKKN
jgi:uncharacterized membrane protein YcaP (DUF421 family)